MKTNILQTNVVQQKKHDGNFEDVTEGDTIPLTEKNLNSTQENLPNTVKGLKFGWLERPSRKKKSFNVLTFQPPSDDPSSSQNKKSFKINEKSNTRIPIQSKQGISAISLRSNTHHFHWKTEVNYFHHPSTYIYVFNLQFNFYNQVSSRAMS